MNLKEIHTIYFIGIGGIGMSSLAQYFYKNGKIVAGYDKVDSSITKNLKALGITITFKDSIHTIPNQFLNTTSTLVVYTPAIPSTHQQLNYFKDNNFMLLKRAELLGEITKDTICLAVAGTHGKTTTSTILGHILKESGVNATSFLGGISENYNSNLILGGDEISVVEADEFDRSFLQLSPNIACVTSMDADHLDVYGQKESLELSFKEFSQKISQELIVCKGLPLKGKTYAIEEDADYIAKNVRIINGTYYFDVKTPLEYIKNIQFNLPGKHNVLNAVAALAMANSFGVSLQAIAKALLSFKGVKRRFSYKIKTDDLILIDDYAHHPTEINAVINSLRELYPSKKILGVFQPHLYSRTKDFAEDFAISLSKFDEIILLDIYPARELPIEGITSQWLLKKITIKGKKLVAKENIVTNIIKSEAQVIALLGAGDIGDLVNNITKELIVEN